MKVLHFDRVQRPLLFRSLAALILAVSLHPCLPAGKVVVWGEGLSVPLITNAVALAAGEGSSLTLLDDGRVVEWPSSSNSIATVLTNIVAVAAGQYHSLVLRADGTVLVWTEYCCPYTNIPPGLSNVVAIAADGNHNLAVRADGTVVEWGLLWIDGTNAVAQAPPGLTNVVAVAAGWTHSLALRADGTVVGWGYNFSEDRYTGQANPPPDLSQVVAIAAGVYHSLALRTNGTVVAWGDNYFGQTNVPGDLTNVIAISAGSFQTLALKADGTVVGWGAWPLNSSPPYSNVVAIASGYNENLAILGRWAPNVSAQPIWRQLYVGEDCQFQAIADGSDSMTVQWRFNGHDIPGATNALLSIPSVSLTDAGTYTVVASNVLGWATADVALSVIPLRAPLITAQATNQLLQLGTNLVLQVAANGPGLLAYQWYFQGTALSGATNSALAISNTTRADAGVYFVVVSNSAGSIASAPVQLCLPFDHLFTEASGPPIWDYGEISAQAPPLPPLSTNYHTSGPYWDQNQGWVRDDYESTCGSGDLFFDPQKRLVTAMRSCKDESWHLYYDLVFGWVVLSHSSGINVETLFTYPFPSMPTDWNLHMEIAPDRDKLYGQATITLAGGRTFDFQVVGTNFPAAQLSILLLRSDYNGVLTIRAVGPDFAIQSVRGSVYEQAIDYGITTPLSVSVNGSGMVQPYSNGQMLTNADEYALTASAARGNLFNYWVVGDTVPTEPVLHFLMSPNLQVTANFVTNSNILLPSSKGSYSGLFYETNGVRQISAGYFSFSLSANGRFSGKILLDGDTKSFVGQLDTWGEAQLQIKRSNKTTLAVQLRLDSVTGEIAGSISDGSWTAELLAERGFSSSGNPATNYVGVYTLSIPGNHDTAGDFVGDGFMTIAIDFNGAIHMSGDLADGTHFSQASHISKNGEWPFYIPLYSRKGALISWIAFSNLPVTSLGGDLIWFRPALANNKYFPGGLTNETSAIGSSFIGPIPSHGHQQLNFTNAMVLLNGGDLVSAITNVLGASTVGSTNVIHLQWDSINGLVHGSLKHPLTGKNTTLRGVLLQNEGIARGYFLGPTQCGSFEVQQISP